jgi:hypothetical protein
MAKSTTKSEAPEAETFKYGIDDLAKLLGIQSASARVACRKNKIEKAGKAYGWNSRSALEADAAKIQANTKEKPKVAKEEKPAAKTSAKKVTKKAA